MGEPPRDDVVESLAALRRHYLGAAPVRLEQMARGLLSLASDPGDRGALESTMRHFHALAGSGTTFGMPAVTGVAREMDVEVRRMLDAGETPTTEDIARWGRGLDRLREEFSAALPEGTLLPLTCDRPPGGATAERVLVVEDDPVLLETLGQSLREEGYAVHLAGSKKEAMALLRGGLPDALIVDIVLPDGSGLEVLEFVRSWPGGDRLAVLAMSIRSEFLDKVATLHAGADAFLEKPLDLDALKRRLKRFTREARGPDAPKVLSVEDDPAQAEFIRVVLEAGGFLVTTCGDPQGFESSLVASQPDLILMDADLPGLSGFDLTRYLRIEERFATLPVVFLTALGDERARIEAVRAGGDDLLVKPVTPGLLLSTVAARIERARFLKGLLYRDGLTQLYTRGAFLERARIVHALRTRRGEGRAALAIVDLDHFKEVNDRHGHLAGDTVLASFAAMLRKRLRKADAIGRIGGEEFAIVIEDLDKDDATRLVELCLRGFAEMEHTSPEGVRFRVTCSGGVAILGPAMRNLETWLRAADDALYRAKAAGRNRVEVAHAGPASP